MLHAIICLARLLLRLQLAPVTSTKFTAFMVQILSLCMTGAVTSDLHEWPEIAILNYD